MLTMTPIASRLPLLAVALLLGGCGSLLNTAGTSSFECKGEGCPTPFEVYDATNGSNAAVRDGRNDTSLELGNRTSKAEKSPEQKLRAANLRMDLTQVRPSATLSVADAPAAQPLRTAAQVMRIWIAPWVDTNDNLNWPGYVYTDITPKTWNFGERSVRYGHSAPLASLPLPSFPTNFRGTSK